VLYRDIDCFYGPLSQYFNAAVFAVFGPSLMTMVAVNLAIFTAILGLIYACFRRAWGTLAAFVASAVFVSVFAFSQHVGAGNYNYLTPYATETTHGVFVCVLLVAVLARWVDAPSVRASLLAGFLCGLTAVLKPEIMLAAGAVMLAALTLRWWRQGPPDRTIWLAWAGGAVLPSAGFFVYFLFHLPLGEALRAAGNGWLSAGDTTQTGNVMQQKFLGLDRPWANLADHGRATLGALAILAALGAAAWGGDRVTSRGARYALGAALAAGVAGFGYSQIAWADVGHCLLGLVLLYLAFKGVKLWRTRREFSAPPHETLRLLLAVLAASLMARMALNGRIYHYGYYQAALAAVLIPAVVLGEFGGWLRLKNGNGLLAVGLLALLTPGVALVAGHSNEIYRRKTQPIAEGADQFYALPKELVSTGQLVRLALDFFRGQPPGQSLVVLPQGINVNYLTRRPSPVPNFSFFGAVTLNGREAKLVERLRKNPPDWVLLVSVDLREYRIDRYGETSGTGRDILQWLAEDYQRVAKTGGDPLDTRDPGAQIFARKAASP